MRPKACRTSAAEEIAKLGGRLTGSCRRPQIPSVPLPEAFVVAAARCGNRDESFRPPQLLDHVEQLLGHLGNKALGIVVGAHIPRRGVSEHEGRRPLGIGGGEQHGHRSAIEPGHDGRALGTDGVQDEPHVVGPLLPGGEMVERHRVRDPGPAPVEEDQTTERCQAVEEILVQRLLPPKIDVRRHAGEEDQVDGAVPQDLVSDPVIPELGELRRRSQLRKPESTLYSFRRQTTSLEPSAIRHVLRCPRSEAHVPL